LNPESYQNSDLGSIENNDVALCIDGITKNFPGVCANNCISFDVKKGEIHALLGENGAGKSTLMKVLFGLHKPDEGNIFLHGNKVDIKSPREAVELGIGMVHQHFMLVDNLSVLDNVMLGLKVSRPPFLDRGKVEKRFQELSEEYNLFLDLNSYVWQLSVGQQQWLEILKVLYRDVEILILDEPTATLAPEQIEYLYRLVRNLAKEGRTIIFITHKLEEVKALSDRVTVLRDGEIVGMVNTKDTSSEELANMMVGREVSLTRKKRSKKTSSKQVLKVQRVSCLNDRKLQALKNIEFEVNSGEILGIAGVDGNGQKELTECTDGKIILDGKEISKKLVFDPTKVAFIHEDRIGIGLILELSIVDNLFIKLFQKPPYARYGILRWHDIYNKGEALIKEYNIKTTGPRIPVRQLSGGNQQKVVIARETHEKPSLIIASQPTRGLDIGAVEFVHDLLLRERERDTAIVFVSSELSEVLSLSDRVMVMFEGESMGIVDPDKVTISEIGKMMMGERQAGVGRKVSQ
jgi:general nucleoside transport system ATP-binding protein